MLLPSSLNYNVSTYITHHSPRGGKKNARNDRYPITAISVLENAMLHIRTKQLSVLTEYQPRVQNTSAEISLALMSFSFDR